MGGRSTPPISARSATDHRAAATRQLAAAALLFGLLGVALILAGTLVPERARGGPPGASAAPRLLLAEPQPHNMQTLHPIDRLTLADIPGYTPIAVGTRWRHAPSPDGLTLALIVNDESSAFPAPGAERKSRLQLLDLVAWRIHPTPVVVSGEIGWLGFAPGGRTLHWLAFAGGEEVAAQQRAYTLYRYRPGDAAAEALATLPTGLLGEELRQSRSGRELIAYHVVEGHANPQLDFLDLASGRVIATVPFTGVHATPPGTVAEGVFPGLAWDIPRDHLYIASADGETLTVVDLALRATVRQGLIEGPGGAPTEVARLYSPARTPTASTQRSRFLALDSGGTRLITSARTVTIAPATESHWQEHSVVEAMRVLDARSGTVLGEFPLDSMPIAATGAGFLTQSVRFQAGGASTAPGDFRLRLWDADNLREVWQRDSAPGDIWRVALSPDDRLAYLVRPNAAEFFREDTVVPYSQGNTFGIFDFRTKELIAERHIPGGQLIALWHSP